MDSDQRVPFAGMRFRLQVEGIEEGGALEVILPEARIAARSTSKLELGTLTVRRGLTGSSAWYGWWDESRGPKRKATRTVSVVLLDSAGADVLRWTYTGARPIGYAVSSLNALASAPLVESLEIAVNGFEASFGASPTPRKRPRRVAAG